MKIQLLLLLMVISSQLVNASTIEDRVDTTYTKIQNDTVKLVSTYNELNQMVSQIRFNYVEDKWIENMLTEYGYDSAGNNDYAMHYGWDGEWFELAKFHSTFSPTGKETLQIYERKQKKDAEWEFFIKGVTEYDANDNLSSQTMYDWKNEKWIPRSRRLDTYNKKSLKTSSTSSVWDTVSNCWQGMETAEYKYDRKRNLTEEIHSKIENEKIIPQQKTEYTYKGDHLSVAQYLWDESKWVGLHKIDILRFGEEFGLVEAAYAWENGRWKKVASSRF